MIREYALEPELVATWGNRHDFRYFVEKFGVGQPRIVSRYPKPWKRLVWEAFHTDNELERKRIEVLLLRLGEQMIHRRDYVWDPEHSWLKNAQTEDARIPFHAILARANPAGHAKTVAVDRIDDSGVLWATPSGVTIVRSATEMTRAVETMLRVARTIIFVDPYFGAEHLRYRRPFASLLQAVLKDRPAGPPQRIEIHASVNTGSSWEFFESECKKRLPGCVPPGVRLIVRRLSQMPNGENPHNRYILTDVGGVIFGHGLDEGEAGETEDINLLDRAQFEIRWRQHSTEPPEYVLDGVAIEIISA
jgi:hypothetical protein